MSYVSSKGSFEFALVPAPVEAWLVFAPFIPVSIEVPRVFFLRVAVSLNRLVLALGPDSSTTYTATVPVADIDVSTCYNRGSKHGDDIVVVRLPSNTSRLLSGHPLPTS